MCVCVSVARQAIHNFEILDSTMIFNNAMSMSNAN